MWRVIFSHGRDSGPWGGKIQYLSDIAGRLGFSITSVDYRGMPDPDERAEHLLKHLPDDERLILVGSSMGAYVSLKVSKEHPVEGLFLLAPAIGLPGYADPWLEPSAPHTEVVHGWRDHLIEPQNVLKWGSQHRCTLHFVDDNHRLLISLPQIGGWFEDFLTARLRDVENRLQATCYSAAKAYY
ncbi:predicted hydrolase of the alpha/beta superfamily [Hahella chejuensis KCTC 2396]|uniref:Predicted hydrolase of the alpha/beta superfamily n=1 Tax=Hahella chejuensis (strain KCTC 2396) TaxID=349521 RepID=Q2SQ48_HAHCH|nr:alpha/beta hydrolase [Hahella chejuensis]ABC27226.1 predicted hydrolase of the alpha/beta superfamily [Hahella chejuensis KCTC 2396]